MASWADQSLRRASAQNDAAAADLASASPLRPRGRPHEISCNNKMTTFSTLLASLSPYLSDGSLLCGRSGDKDWPSDASWAEFLLALPREDVEACERLGLHRVARVRDAAPESLRRLCATVASASAALGRGAEGSTCSCCQSAIAASHRAFRQSAEKSEQVSALLASASARLELSRVRRVVDVGCGKGHLVSKLRSELGVPALGVDVDDAVLDAARATYPEVECFECRDVVAAGLPLQAGDLVVGLHPCGALGEAIVRAVRDCARGEGESGGGGDGGSSCALLMVPCCWHKQGSSVAAREPLSERARMLDAIAETVSGGDECGVAIEDDDATAASVTGNGGGAASAAVGGGGGMRLPLAALKKASMALDSTGSVQTRRARHELRELLRIRGIDVSRREDMDGIHPKKARRGLEALASEALRLRGLPEPTEEELREAVAAASAPFEAIRRLSLLEPTLGELVELAALLDRALALEEVGMGTSVFRAFDQAASDRNLCIASEVRAGVQHVD